MEPKKKIMSFRDLDVYRSTYEAMLIAFKYIIPKLPRCEDHDLKAQLMRSVKAIPRLIAEGHSKRHQNKGFQRYIDDAMAESNETIVSLQQASDLYAEHIDVSVCKNLIETYDIASRQLYKLAQAWDGFKSRSRTTNNHSSSSTFQPNITNGRSL